MKIRKTLFPAIRFALIFSVLFFAISNGFCDSLILTDGQTITGRIVGETDGAVTIEATNGRFTFMREKVLTVTKESPVRNQLRQVELLLSRGNIDAAVAFFNQVNLDKQIPDETFNALFLNQLRDNAIGVKTTSGTALLLAEKFSRGSSTPMELLLLGAVLCIDTGNNDQASALLRQIEKDVPKQLVWPEKTVSALLNRIADAAVAGNHGTILAQSAALAARLPLTMPTGAEGNLQLYAKIDERVREKHLLEASSLFRPDLFLRRADLFVPLADRLMTAIIAGTQNDATLAALESANVTVLPYVDASLRLRCMKILITRLVDSGNTTEAQRIADSTSAKEPDLGATLQHLMEFQNRKASLAENAPLDMYKLAAWGRDMGLLDESKALFVKLRGDPRFSENVNLQLSLIEHAQAMETVAKLKGLYSRNEIEQLKQEAAAFLSTAPPEQFAQQTRDLLQLADFQNWSHAKSSQGKAEAEFQQAERLANRQEYDAALAQLNRLQLEKGDTAAAHKAQALRDRIMREKIRQIKRRARNKETSAARSNPSLSN